LRALIVDEGRDRSAVAAARALAADGWTVGSAACVRSLASRSSAVSRFHLVPHTGAGMDRFLEGTVAALHQGRYDIVFALWDAALLELSARRDRLPAELPYPAHDVVARGSDKQAVSEAAARVGLSTPRTVVATPESLADWEGPVVIKPASHAPALFGAARYPRGEDAVGRAEEIRSAGGIPLAQEVIEGRLVALATVVDREGRLVTTSQQVAVHVWPRQAGITARGVTVPVDQALEAQVAELLRALGWFGLVQLQFLVPPDGRPYLIDFNARFYGSLALAVRAGANHPVAWARLALGLPAAPAVARPGVRFQWFTRDVRASLTSGRPAIEVPRALVLAPFAAHSVWSAREPALAVRFLAAQAGRAVARRVRRRLGRLAASTSVRALEVALRLVAAVPALRSLLTRRAAAAQRGEVPLLFVCHGNLSRSAFAAALVRRSAPDRVVAEAGCHPVGGRASPAAAIEAAREWDVDLTAHRSKVLAASDMDGDAAVFVFDARNLLHVLSRSPRAWRRVHLVASLAPGGSLSIPDPHGQPDAAFREAFARIAEALSRSSP
jgi:protein-tyrosine-phosphatase/predicted ATP-grasp superfamily ATP-dependent carboligase